jgi:hypothetical protein
LLIGKNHTVGLILTILLVHTSTFAQCTSEKIAFLAFGDAGMGNATQNRVASSMVNFCRQGTCDFVALLGDNIYPNGVDSPTDPQWKQKFELPYKEIEVPFYPTLGNHDYFGNIEAQWEYSKVNPKWKFPERYYTFTQCFADFFVIDAERFDEEQALWLEEALALSRARWKIVVGHRPIFSHGGHGDSEKLKENLLPVIKEKAHFYLSGHDHDLEYIKKEYKTEFIVSGAAAETRPVGKGKSTLFSASIEGFTHIELTPDKSIIQFIDQDSRVLFKHFRNRKKQH